MYFDKSLNEVTILLVLLCNREYFFFIDELVLIEESIGNYGHVELLIILVLDVLILIIVLMMYLKETKRISQFESLNNFLLVLFEHIRNQSIEVLPNIRAGNFESREARFLFLLKDSASGEAIEFLRKFTLKHADDFIRN